MCMTASIKRELFGDIDFTSLKDNLKFKESDVREEIIMPLLSYYADGAVATAVVGHAGDTSERPFSGAGGAHGIG